MKIYKTQEEEEKTLRLLLRSVYIKGHQDAINKTADVLSWEDKIVENIKKLHRRGNGQECHCESQE